MNRNLANEMRHCCQVTRAVAIAPALASGKEDTPLFNHKLGNTVTIYRRMAFVVVAKFSVVVCGKCIRSGNWLVANREWLIDELVPPAKYPIHPSI